MMILQYYATVHLYNYIEGLPITLLGMVIIPTMQQLNDMQINLNIKVKSFKVMWFSLKNLVSLLQETFVKKISS